MTAVEVVDDAAAICPSLIGKASMCPLPASMGHRGRAPPRDRLPRLGIRHLRAPCRPQTNGKGERFIRTMLSGWAYGAIYRNSDERTAALDGWLWHYNCQRRRSSSATSPRSLVLTREETNFLGTYT